jgi:hypothetical protein
MNCIICSEIFKENQPDKVWTKCNKCKSEYHTLLDIYYIYVDDYYMVIFGKNNTRIIQKYDRRTEHDLIIKKLYPLNSLEF